MHIRNSKTLFNAAVDADLISGNPFRKQKSRSIANDSDRVITVEETEKLIDNAPSTQWRALIGLCRYAGLRTPSETDSLTWADVDFEARRLRVRSPKTERFEGKAERLTPISPRLMELLQAAFDEADEGTVHVITLPSNNRHRRMESIIKTAVMERWPDLFHALRRSCASEWVKTLPAHAVARWLGHSEAVSRKHYLKVDEDLFTKVSQRAADGRCTEDEKALQTGAAEGSGTERKGDTIEAPVGATTDDDSMNYDESSETELNGPGRNRTDNQKIMSPLL